MYTKQVFSSEKNPINPHSCESEIKHRDLTQISYYIYYTVVRNLCQFPVNLNNIAWNNCKIFCKKLLISYLYQLELNTYKNCFYHKRYISHIQYFTRRSCDGYENFNSILRLKITTPIKAPELSNNDRLVKMISFFFKLKKRKLFQ